MSVIVGAAGAMVMSVARSAMFMGMTCPAVFLGKARGAPEEQGTGGETADGFHN